MTDYSILVVEDEHTLRRLLEYRLNKFYQVRTAANGEEALARIDEEIPDLIISDIMMPKMDGFALQTALQEHKNTRTIPFIFLTAKADDMSRLKGMRMGVDDYITKPFDIEQLLSRINRLLERTRLFQTQLDARIGDDFSRRLMPRSMPTVDGYALMYHNEPKEYGGGDLFDWIEPIPGTYFITIGDVMGKGLQAKFYAHTFLSYIRGTLHAMMDASSSPAWLMKRVNRVLMEDQIMEETFASLLLLRWEPAKHLITYANAGHCRPILLSNNGARIIAHSDLILGLDKNADFSDATVTVEPGNTLIAYTDALIEQKTPGGTMLGEELLSRLAADVVHSPRPIDTLLQKILECSAEKQFEDDILVFWLNRALVEQPHIG